MLINEDNRLPAGELDEHHIFRTKEFKHLYYCPNCKRSFDAKEAMDKCKICSGDIVELKPEVKEETNYRYYCPVCEKNFTLTEKAEKCINCGNRIIHQYAWSGTSKTDKLRMRKFEIKSLIKRLLSRMRSIKTNQVPAPQPKPMEFRNKDGVENTIQDIIIENSSFVRPIIRLNPFSRNIEEIPTY